MFQKLTIEGFRRFKHFELNDLGQVNLLVGTNNCGKSTVLEALDLLCARDDEGALSRILKRRGEIVSRDAENGGGAPQIAQLDARRLFYGHEPSPGQLFSVSASEAKGGATYEIHGGFDDSRSLQQRGAGDTQADHGVRRFSLTWEHGASSSKVLRELSVRAGIDTAPLYPSSELDGTKIWPPGPVQSIEPASMLPSQVITMYSDVALTSAEDVILEALRLIEPSIERVAIIAAGTRSASTRGGFVVRCQGQDERVPIGTMGDGIWRALGLSLSLVNAVGGLLLVDEIDTGLHYSVMKDMWRVLCQTATRLDVQVFATAHSHDCWQSLAAVAQEAQETPINVSIHRIEREADRAVRFSEQEMIAAAERGLEVR